MRGARLLTGLCLAGTIGCAGQSAPSSPSAGASSPTSQECAFTPASGVPAFNAAGGSASIAIATAAACRWTVMPASSADAWIVLETPTPTVGPATVAFTAQPNRSFAPRTGAIVVRHANGDVLATYGVTERGAGCLYSVEPQAEILTSLGTYDGAGDGPLRIQVHAEPATCQWRASSTTPWLHVVYRDGGTGDGDFYISVIEWNWTPNARAGDIVVAGLSGVNPDARLSVTQNGR